MDMIAAGGLLWMYVCVYDCAGVIQRWTDGSLRAICCMRQLERGFIRDRMHAVVLRCALGANHRSGLPTCRLVLISEPVSWRLVVGLCYFVLGPFELRRRSTWL